MGKIEPSHTTINTRSGLKISAKTLTDLSIIDEIFTWKIYDRPPFRLPHDGVVVDVGANIGVFSLYAAAKGNQVYSYEPVRQNYENLKQNIKQNQLDNVYPIEKALAGSEGNRTLYLDIGSSSRHSFYGQGEPIKVDCTTLPKAFEANSIEKCDFLKIDCEGAEYEILQSLDSNFLRKIQTVCLEYHDTSRIQQLADHLKQARFTVKVETKPHPILRAKKNARI